MPKFTEGPIEGTPGEWQSYVMEIHVSHHPPGVRLFFPEGPRQSVVFASAEDLKSHLMHMLDAGKTAFGSLSQPRGDA